MILVDDDEVGGLAGLDGAGLVLLLHGHRTVSGEDLDRGLDIDPLVRVELAVLGLAGVPAGDHALEGEPRIRLRNVVPVAAVGHHGARVDDGLERGHRQVEAVAADDGWSSGGWRDPGSRAGTATPRRRSSSARS